MVSTTNSPLLPRASWSGSHVGPSSTSPSTSDVSSPTFGEWVGHELSEDNFKQLWIPPGFAHGFLALTDLADVLYKTTDYYAPELDRSIRWDDPNIGIDWPLATGPRSSRPRTQAAPSLDDAELFD